MAGKGDEVSRTQYPRYLRGFACTRYGIGPGRDRPQDGPWEMAIDDGAGSGYRRCARRCGLRRQ